MIPHKNVIPVETGIYKLQYSKEIPTFPDKSGQAVGMTV